MGRKRKTSPSLAEKMQFESSTRANKSVAWSLFGRTVIPTVVGRGCQPKNACGKCAKQRSRGHVFQEQLL